MLRQAFDYISKDSNMEVIFAAYLVTLVSQYLFLCRDSWKIKDQSATWFGQNSAKHTMGSEQYCNILLLVTEFFSSTHIKWLKLFNVWEAPSVVSSIVVVGALTCFVLRHSTWDLKAAQMNNGAMESNLRINAVWVWIEL